MKFKYLLQTYRLYSMITNIASIKTFVFLDLETTGLPQYEFGATKITELSLIAAQADHIRLGVLPRVQNKLSLCFNPRKEIQTKAAEITGLSNELLEYQEEFCAATVNLIEIFLNLQYKPVCLVAHNGNRFDFPILRTEISRVNCELPSNIICVDSLPMFRHLHQEDMEKTVETSIKSDVPIELMDGYDDFLCSLMDDVEAAGTKSNKRAENIQIENETTPKKPTHQHDGSLNETVLDNVGSNLKETATSSNCLDLYFNPLPQRANKAAIKKPTAKKVLFHGIPFTLSSVYERLTKKLAVDTHRAESDSKILLECALAYGDRFVSYSNYNASPFQNVPLLRFGKKIGT